MVPILAEVRRRNRVGAAAGQTEQRDVRRVGDLGHGGENAAQALVFAADVAGAVDLAHQRETFDTLFEGELLLQGGVALQGGHGQSTRELVPFPLEPRQAQQHEHRRQAGRQAARADGYDQHALERRKPVAAGVRQRQRPRQDGPHRADGGKDAAHERT